jgi:molybdenum-dependent DNA-binding transcriptional regulator ModE
VVNAVRTLPIRVTPLAGEALDSWLEEIAYRSRTEFNDVLAAVGLPARKPSGDSAWIVRLSAGEIESLGVATDATGSTLESMTLSRYFGRGIQVDPVTGRMGRGFLWGRGKGSRFCPDCLADSNGRWPLKWRLRWTFACTTHHRLLADACPDCGLIQRLRPHIGELIPQPCLCAAPRPGARNHERCHSDLTIAGGPTLDADHLAIRAQTIIDDLIAAKAATFGVYADHPQPSMNALADVRTIAHRALSHGTPKDLERLIPADLLEQLRLGLEGHDDQRRRQATATPGPSVPARVATAAVGIVAALASLDSPSVAASAPTLRWLVGYTPSLGHYVFATNKRRGSPTTPVLASMELAALETVLKPTDQLRYRIGSPTPTPPTRSTPTAAHMLAWAIPTALWPAWSLRLAVPNWDHRQLRLALSAAVQIVHSRLRLGEAIRLIDSPLKSPLDVSRLLRAFHRHEHWRDIRQALTTIADYLREGRVPIDYQRRRRIDYTALLPDSVWAQICLDTASEKGTAMRARVVRCYLFERLSGMPADMAPFAHETTHFRRAVADFPGCLTTELASALQMHGSEFLEAHRITDEPPLWQPPATLLHGLRLPGPNLSTIDPELLRHMPAGTARIGHAADHFGISAAAARYLVEMNPAHPPAWVSGKVPRPHGRGAYRIAKDALPPKRLTDLYIRQRQSLDVIASNVGVSKTVIKQLATAYGLELRPSGPKVKHIFDRNWLVKQYVDKQRSLPDIAAEVGVASLTVGRWLAKYAIPARAPGPGTHSAALAAITASRRAPEILRPALTTPAGWRRLHRFEASMKYPTLTIAAKHLGLNRAALCLQIARIEEALGQHLLVRAERGRAMMLTQAGEQVVAAIDAANRTTEASITSPHSPLSAAGSSRRADNDR